MKQSMYKSKEEVPMFLTVMDVANLLGIFSKLPIKHKCITAQPL